MKLVHRTYYTMMAVERHGDVVQEEVFDELLRATEFTFRELALTKHLFISALAAAWMEVGEAEDGEPCFASGVYHRSLQSLAICAGPMPDDPHWEGNESKWRDWIISTLIHEIIHFWQDLNGTLGGPGTEQIAEAKTEELVDAWKQWKAKQ
jgi:hypothetical protein